MDSKATGAEFGRRDFVKGATVAALAAGIGTRAFAQGTDTIKVGLVGCGGRGTGALDQNVRASGQPGMVVHAVGDVFEDKAKGFGANITKNWGDKAKIDDRMFGGWDAYKKVIDSGIDLLVTATPPGVRPYICAYAIEKGKHVFAEKPVAVDAHGVNVMLEAAKMADEKKLCFVTGTQRRYQAPYLGTMQLIHDGALGDIVTGYVGWRGGGIWERLGKRKSPDSFALSWQLDNWYHFNWLCGDQIVEQHVHNLDVLMWAFKDVHPTSCYAIGYRVDGNNGGGRPTYSHMYSGISAEFTFPNGAKCMSWSGHGNIDGYGGEQIVGTKGKSNCTDGITLNDGSKIARVDVKVDNGDPYVQEHIALIKHIRAGEQVNEAKRIAESTFMAVMAREAAYSGKRVSWDALLKSDFSLMPPAELLDLEKDPDIPVPPVAVPGRYKLPTA